ncbi:Uncharacterized protein HZ326_6837 [Fusarium oxysporum f. sp. albedinis]|nr:Uncharacterized protein HZ326_6837 [Fusarium oxysporum f. sp. albedinis]
MHVSVRPLRLCTSLLRNIYSPNRQTIHSLQAQQASQWKQGNRWRFLHLPRLMTFTLESLDRSLAGQDSDTCRA